MILTTERLLLDTMIFHVNNLQLNHPTGEVERSAAAIQLRPVCLV